MRFTTVKKADLLPHLTKREEHEDYVNRTHSIPARRRNELRYQDGVKASLWEWAQIERNLR